MFPGKKMKGMKITCLRLATTAPPMNAILINYRIALMRQIGNYPIGPSKSNVGQLLKLNKVFGHQDL